MANRRSIVNGDTVKVNRPGSAAHGWHGIVLQVYQGAITVTFANGLENTFAESELKLIDKPNRG